MTQEMTPENTDLLAAEYALGLLSGDELTAAQTLARTDPSFAQSVTDWEIRLAALTDDLAPQTPSDRVKKELLAKLFDQPKRASFWENLRVWQGAAVLSMLALAAFIAFSFTPPTPSGGPLYTAEIATETGDFRVIAVVDKTANEVILTKTAGAAPAGRILQVWAHGEGEPAVSVGLWPQGDSIRLPMPQSIASVQGVLTLGVSEEPPGGSQTGGPSGRVFGTVDIPGVSG